VPRDQRDGAPRRTRVQAGGLSLGCRRRPLERFRCLPRPHPVLLVAAAATATNAFWRRMRSTTSTCATTLRPGYCRWMGCVAGSRGDAAVKHGASRGGYLPVVTRTAASPFLVLPIGSADGGGDRARVSRAAGGGKEGGPAAGADSAPPEAVEHGSSHRVSSIAPQPVSSIDDSGADRSYLDEQTPASIKISTVTYRFTERPLP
jgi:hypothetical protein